MNRPYWLLAASASTCAVCWAAPLRAQDPNDPRCEIQDGMKICPVGPPIYEPPPRRVPDEPVYIPPDPAVEKLRTDVQTLESAMSQLQSLTSSVSPFLGLPRPVSPLELGSRIDGVLGAVWPEFSATALEAGLLRAQSTFFDGRNAELSRTVSWQRNRVAELTASIPTLERDIAAAGPRLAEARRREAEATVFALAQLNNRASEGRAIATMLAFAPERPVTAAELDDPFRYSAVPGVQSAPGNPLQVASLTAPFAPPREPTSSPPLSLARPAPSDLVDAKLAVLQWAANGWQQDLRELPQLRAAVPNKRAEHSSLQGQADALGNSLFGLDMRANQLRAELQGANARIDVALANAAGSNAVALKEILADVVLDTAAERMRAIAEEIAGAAGIDIPAPPTEARQFLDYVRRGGRVLLPIEGYAQQWEAFNDAQQLALDGLGKTQGFISEAAQVLATGSVSETLALAERVFATVEWQAFDYFKTTGLSGLPDDEDKPAVVDWLERYADKRRAQETGG